MKKIFTLLSILIVSTSFAQTYRWMGNGNAQQTISSQDGFFSASNYRLVNADRTVSGTAPTSLPSGATLEIVGVDLTLSANNSTSNIYKIVIQGGSRPGLTTPDFRNGQITIANEFSLVLDGCGASSIELVTGVLNSNFYFGRITLGTNASIQLRALRDIQNWTARPHDNNELVISNNGVYQKQSSAANNLEAPTHIGLGDVVNRWIYRGPYNCTNTFASTRIIKALGPNLTISSNTTSLRRAVSSAQASTGEGNADGFVQASAGPIALPVQLIGFTASKGNGKVVLNWSTAQEINSDFFELQRSTDGSNWSVVTRVKSNGNSNIIRHYQAEDAGNFSGNVLYRIRMVDTDATFAFSNIARLSFGAGKGKIFAYPNPASGFTTISSDNALTGDITIGVYNVATGNMVKQQVLRNPGNAFRLGLEGMAAGNYIIKVYSGKELLESMKIVKY